MAMLLGMMFAPIALNSCSDDDEDEDVKTENNQKPGDENQKPEEGEKPTEGSTVLKETYKVDIDMMALVKWTDDLAIVKNNEESVNVTLAAENIPSGGYVIKDAKFENVTLVKTDKGYKLSNTGDKFAASMKMSGQPNAPLKEYSTADEAALLTVSDFEGTIEGDKLTLNFKLKAGRMPMDIPFTLTTAAE